MQSPIEVTEFFMIMFAIAVSVVSPQARLFHTCNTPRDFNPSTSRRGALYHIYIHTRTTIMYCTGVTQPLAFKYWTPSIASHNQQRRVPQEAVGVPEKCDVSTTQEGVAFFIPSSKRFSQVEPCDFHRRIEGRRLTQTAELGGGGYPYEK